DRESVWFLVGTRNLGQHLAVRHTRRGSQLSLLEYFLFDITRDWGRRSEVLADNRSNIQVSLVERERFYKRSVAPVDRLDLLRDGPVDLKAGPKKDGVRAQL